MKAIIDAELFLYRAAASSEYEVEWAPDDWTYLCRHGEAKASFQSTVLAAQEMLPDHTVTLALGDPASFRYGLYPAYKANRRTTRKPAGYKELMRWLSSVAATRGWECVSFPDVEADDVIGLINEPGNVVVSEDKDMLTLPGLHLRGGEFVEVSLLEADRAFMLQTLMGDKADNYPGIKGCGPVSAEKILADCQDIQQMWGAVVAAYKKAGHSADYALTMARLARILRAGEYDFDKEQPQLWVPPGRSCAPR